MGAKKGKTKSNRKPEPMPINKHDAPCPLTCPFLKEERLFTTEKSAQCDLFQTPLVIQQELALKCQDCLHSDRRKAQYQAKKMLPEQRLAFWKQKIKSLKTASFEINLSENPDRKEINAVLKAQMGQFGGLMDKDTCQLIQNIYMVLDGTEKSIMMSILTNPYTIQAFLKKLRGMNKSNQLLSTVRREMDKIDREEQLRQQQLTQELHQNRRLYNR